MIIPFIGSGVASLFFADAPLLFAALMIYFLAPCTDWFLGFTRMAKGDTVLGAALIPINMITQLLLFPIWLWLLTRSSGLVDLGTLPNMLFEWFLLPLLAAQAFRLVLERFTPSKTAEQFFSFANRLVPYVLAALIVQIFATHSGTISASPGIFVTVAQAVCAFFAATLLVGATLSRLAGLDHPQHALLAMTMTARNAPLMLALTAVAVPDQPLVLAVIVSAMLVEMPLLTALRELLLFRARIR
ncbi:MAG: arsenic resistance protein [Pseudomonadota bacterium]